MPNTSKLLHHHPDLLCERPAAHRPRLHHGAGRRHRQAQRALGFDTWFLTGTDEHGQKIERSAQQAGQTPQEFANAVSGQFRSLGTAWG